MHHTASSGGSSTHRRVRHLRALRHRHHRAGSSHLPACEAPLPAQGRHEKRIQERNRPAGVRTPADRDSPARQEERTGSQGGGPTRPPAPQRPARQGRQGLFRRASHHGGECRHELDGDDGRIPPRRRRRHILQRPTDYPDAEGHSCSHAR